MSRIDNESTLIYLNSNLSFPIEILRLLISNEDLINKSQLILSFKDSNNNILTFEAPIKGKLLNWLIIPNQILLNHHQPILIIQEECIHPVQFAGQCALCGKDLSVVDYTGFSDTSRANVRMAHDHTQLTVSHQEAQRLEAQTTTRLLSVQKLSLIVDLDQTIIHATVDRSVQDWLDDPSHPNHDALVGTERFQLGAVLGEAEDPYWYYVKPRPGLKEFLKSVSAMYEMHVYTMGTRAYASQVCNVIDPDGSFFSGRILSRDESGSMTRKSLQRLFPCDTSMVVIIDDRADVWDRSPNLVKVIPYEFFVGIGDINAAFLPKRKEVIIPAPAGSSSPSPTTSTSDHPISIDPTLDVQVFDEDASTPTIVHSLSEATASTAIILHDQIENRPLSHNKVHHPHTHRTSTAAIEGEPFLDLEVGHIEGESTDEDEGEVVLRDDDRELERVFAILKDVHGKFYRCSDPRAADVKDIIPAMKREVLRDVRILFSGLIALNDKPEESEFWQMANAFGATCLKEVDSQVTHVAATQLGTMKVQAAQKIKGVHIVWAQWLMDTAATWCRQTETDYYLANDSDPPTALKFPSGSDSNFIPNSISNSSVLNTYSDVASSSSFDGVADVGGTDDEEDSKVDVAAINWADAAREVDDFLNETDGDTNDDEDEEEEGDDDESDFDRPTKKRVRVTTDSEDEGLRSIESAIPRSDTKGKGKASYFSASSVPTIATGSALSKRIKKSRSRKSRLKVSFPSTSDDLKDDMEYNDEGSTPTPMIPIKASRPTIPKKEEVTASQESSLESDDEAFLAAMAAEVELGWCS